jgi:hypothetical protein
VGSIKDEKFLSIFSFSVKLLTANLILGSHFRNAGATRTSIGLSVAAIIHKSTSFSENGLNEISWFSSVPWESSYNVSL